MCQSKQMLKQFKRNNNGTWKVILGYKKNHPTKGGFDQLQTGFEEVGGAGFKPTV